MILTPLSKLQNLAPTIIKKLNEVGIYTKEDLILRGPIEAYKEIKRNNQDKLIPVSYYLYSMYGALTNTKWDQLPAHIRQDLRKRARS